MNRAPLRVAVVTNLIPHYRAEFYRAVFQRADLDLRVYCQAALPGANIQSAHERFPGRVVLVRAWALGREALGWQHLPWRELLAKYDVLFILGNPRVLSNVVLSLVARFLGRRVVIWGQAHTAGAHPATERLRLRWWRGFNHLFVYTDGEVAWLRHRGFRQNVVGMNNGLDQHRIDAAAAGWDGPRLERWQHEEGLAGRIPVLSCARLEAKNRFDLWIEAMPEVCAKFPDLLWCVIGEGTERAALERRTRQLGLEPRVKWLGAVIEESRLAPWFLSSRVLIHPSAIGLSLLHAFGYALPVVTHDDPELQMPEYSAFVPGETGIAYAAGNAHDLARAVIRCLEDEPARRQMGERARRLAREEYNVQVMERRFAEVAWAAAGGPNGEERTRSSGGDSDRSES